MSQFEAYSIPDRKKVPMVSYQVVRMDNGRYRLKGVGPKGQNLSLFISDRQARELGASVPAQAKSKANKGSNSKANKGSNSKSKRGLKSKARPIY